MHHLRSYLSFIFILFFLAGCTKPGTNNPALPAGSGKPNGILYINAAAEFVKIDTRDSSVFWTSENFDYGGSAGNPMIFDSTNFYFGNNNSVFAYTSKIGVPIWQISWPFGYQGTNIYHQEVAFTDTLVFITSSTDYGEPSSLRCVSKKNGTVYWTNVLDSGDLSTRFNTTPLVINNSVIVMKRDANNHKWLVSFATNTGNLNWTTGINDSLPERLRLNNGKIYATAKQQALCYSATDGSLLWQTDFQLTAPAPTSTFFDQDKLIVVKVSGINYSVFTLNTTNGSIISKIDLTVPTQETYPQNAPLGCNYYTNTLIVTSAYNTDSVSITSYDLLHMTFKWEKHFADYAFTKCTPMVTDKYIMFPIIDNTAQKAAIYFLDFNGNQVTSIPFTPAIQYGYVYIGNGIVYKLDNEYVGTN